jgi:ABC-type glycerol-3-phosphate transport system substrate-binding protein
MWAQQGVAMSLFMLSVFVLAAICNRSGGGSGGKASEKAVPLTVWGDLSSQAVLRDCFGAINTAFTKQYPNIVLDYGYASVEDINAAYRSDSLPDLFYVQGNKSSSMAEMARAGLLLPLDQFNPDASLYPPASVEYAQVDGVYYNADIFAAHGLKKPAAYGEFTAAAETLFAAGITPFALGGSFEWSRYWPLQTPGCLFPEVVPDLMNNNITGDEGMRKIIDEMNR